MTERCCLVYCTETVAYDSLDLIGDVDFNLEPGVGCFWGFDDGVHLSVLWFLAYVPNITRVVRGYIRVITEKPGRTGLLFTGVELVP
jgi:hypothetical protein